MENQTQERRPFGEAAKPLTDQGLVVLPCPGSNGKSPKGAVQGFNKWEGPRSAAFIDQMSRRWPHANIGIIAGASGLTVIDVDGGEDIAKAMMKALGETPVVVETPSGGRHLYYRHNGERNANLRPRYPVDIKATAGVVVVPPSVDVRSGRTYRFHRGSFEDLYKVPMIDAKALEALVPNPYRKESQLARGNRNNGLFKLGLRFARQSKTADELLAALSAANQTLVFPVPDEEIGRIARSAWQYQSKGSNWVGQAPIAPVSRAILERLRNIDGAVDALWLYCILQHNHGGKNGEHAFAAVPEAISRAGLVPFSGHRVRRGLKNLVGVGLLVRSHEGGAGQHDPAKFMLTRSEI